MDRVGRMMFSWNKLRSNLGASQVPFGTFWDRLQPRFGGTLGPIGWAPGVGHPNPEVARPHPCARCGRHPAHPKVSITRAPRGVLSSPHRGKPGQSSMDPNATLQILRGPSGQVPPVP